MAEDELPVVFASQPNPESNGLVGGCRVINPDKHTRKHHAVTLICRREGPMAVVT
jgi:hypothetical protein